MQSKVIIAFVITLLALNQVGCSNGGSDSAPPPNFSSSSATSSSTTSSSSSTSSSNASSSLANTAPAVVLPEDVSVTEDQTLLIEAVVSDDENNVTDLNWQQTAGPQVTWEEVSATAIRLQLPSSSSKYSISITATAVDAGGLEGSDDVSVVKLASRIEIIAAGGDTPLGNGGGGIVSLLPPSIGANGDIAYISQLQSTGQFALKSVLWAGKPDSIDAVLESGDRVNGVTSRTFELGVGQPAVNGRGDVLIKALLSGNAAGEALLAVVDGKAQYLMEIGERAPGFSSSTILSEISYYAISGQGAAIVGVTSSGVHALWVWDFNELQLIAAGASQSSEYKNIDQAEAPHYDQNCYFREINLSNTIPLQINDRGQILFWTVLKQDGPSTNCPDDKMEYVLWENGRFKTVFASETPVPNMLGYQYYLHTDFDRVVLFDDGRVTLSTRIFEGEIFDEDESIPSIWEASSEPANRLVSLAGEQFSDGNSHIGVDFFAQLGVGAYKCGEENVCIIEPEEITGYETVLRGPARVNPYTHTELLETNPMEVLLRVDDRAPGGGFISSMDYFSASRAGSVTVVGSRRDNNIANENEQVVWHGSTRDDFEEVIAAGSSLTYSGETGPVYQFLFDSAPAGAGLPVQASSSGIVVFAATFGARPAIVLYVP